MEIQWFIRSLSSQLGQNWNRRGSHDVLLSLLHFSSVPNFARSSLSSLSCFSGRNFSRFTCTKHTLRDNPHHKISSTEGVNNKDKQLHVIMFPFLAFGHISPFVKLSNKLFSHGVRVTFLSASSNIPRIKTAFNLNSSINVIPLQFPNGVTSTAELPPDLAGN